VGGKNTREIKYHKASKQLKRTILFTDMGGLVLNPRLNTVMNVMFLEECVWAVPQPTALTVSYN
jgi:hypothetical protein